MDRFCVSDAAYHEFSTSVHGMERSYLARQCRSDLHKLIHITRTPGHQPGVQMSFKEELHYQLKKVSPKLFAYIYLELHALPHQLKMKCARCTQVCYFTRRTLYNVLLRGLCLVGQTKFLLNSSSVRNLSSLCCLKYNWVVPEKKHTPLHRGNFCRPEGGREKKLFLIIGNVLGHLKVVGVLTSYFLCGGGMDVFWNDPLSLKLHKNYKLNFLSFM